MLPRFSLSPRQNKLHTHERWKRCNSKPSRKKLKQHVQLDEVSQISTHDAVINYKYISVPCRIDSVFFHFLLMINDLFCQARHAAVSTSIEAQQSIAKTKTEAADSIAHATERLAKVIFWK